MINKKLYFVIFNNLVTQYQNTIINRYKKIFEDYEIVVIHYTIEEIENICDQSSFNDIIKYSDYDFLLHWSHNDIIKNKIQYNIYYIETLRRHFIYVILNYYGGVYINFNTYPLKKWNENILNWDYFLSNTRNNEIIFGCQKNKINQNKKYLEDFYESDYRIINKIISNQELDLNTTKSIVTLVDPISIDFCLNKFENITKYDIMYNDILLNIQSKRITCFICIHDIKSLVQNYNHNSKYSYNRKYVTCMDPSKIENYNYLKNRVLDLYNTEFGKYNKYIGKYSGFLYCLKNFTSLSQDDYLMYCSCGWVNVIKHNNINENEISLYLEGDEYDRNKNYKSIVKYLQESNDNHFKDYINNYDKYFGTHNTIISIIVPRKMCLQLYNEIIQSKILDIVIDFDMDYFYKYHLFLVYLQYIIANKFKFNYKNHISHRIHDSISHKHDF